MVHDGKLYFPVLQNNFYPTLQYQIYHLFMVLSSPIGLLFKVIIVFEDPHHLKVTFFVFLLILFI